MQTTTYHAPAERASLDECRRQRAVLLSKKLVFEVLDGCIEPSFLLNSHRQVVALNAPARRVLGRSGDAVLGQRPGEALRCVHRADGPGGCGTGPSCVYCGAVAAVLEAMDSERQSERACQIAHDGGDDGGAFELTLRAKPLQVDDERYTLISLRDTSATWRRAVLERLLEHDLINALGGIRGLAEIMVEEDDPKILKACAGDILQVAMQLVDQIEAQRQLRAAEHDQLAVAWSAVEGGAVLEEVAQLYRHHPVNHGQSIDVSVHGDCRLITDPALLSRALGNLVKNAVEAALPADEIRCRATRLGADRVVFSVHNPQVMTEEVQRKVFLRSFSTKARIGRGVGTFGARLLVERYLNGRVTFTSRAGQGTTFRIELPLGDASSQPS